MMTREVRQAVLARMPNLIADGYESPRSNLQTILTRLTENITDLQRRGA